MLYFGMLLVTLTMVFLITMVGLRVSDLLPARLRPIGRFYFSPLFGLAVFILIATLHGWIAPFKQWMILSETFPLLLLAFYFEKKKRSLLPYFLILLLFSILTSTTVLFTMLRFDAYNSFNDTFTYLVHGQWLQTHAFSERVTTSGYYPALTQISLYQGAGHRMGASFLLGWVQAAFGLTWSYYAYPVAILLPFIAGSLAVGGAVKLIVPRQRAISILTACATAVTPNGFSFGAGYGFFPQTFGLAFAVGSVTLLGALIIQSSRGYRTKKTFFSTLPVSLVFAALALTYNDLMPFIGAAAFVFFSLSLIFHYSEMKKVLLPISILIAQVAMIINFEFIRILRNFIQTLLGVAGGSHAIGWPVLWSPLEFLAHSFGFKSAVGIGWTLISPPFTEFTFLLVISLLSLFLFLTVKQKSSVYLHLNSLVILIFIVGFVYFRYFVKSISPAETGHTFLQFKLAKWASPFCLIWLGAGFAYFAERFKSSSKILIGLLVILILINIPQNYERTEKIMGNFLNETGYRYSAFSSFIHLRELVKNLDENEVIYLNLGNIHHKMLQMVAYILYDRKVAADYARSDDGYILGHLPADQRSMSIESASWIIDYVPPDIEHLTYPRVGNLVLKRRSDFLINFISATGGYNQEGAGANWWYWTSGSLEFKYRILGTLKKARLKFIYMPATEGRDLNVVIQSKKETQFTFKMKGGWNTFDSLPVDVDGPDITIKFISDEKPVRISDSDPRLMSFLIKNLEITGIQPD